MCRARDAECGGLIRSTSNRDRWVDLDRHRSRVFGSDRVGDDDCDRVGLRCSQRGDRDNTRRGVDADAVRVRCRRDRSDCVAIRTGSA